MIRNLIFTAFLCISTSANAEMPFSQYSQLKIDLTKYGKFVGAYEGCTARNSFQADWEQLGEKSEKEKEKKVIDRKLLTPDEMHMKIISSLEALKFKFEDLEKLDNIIRESRQQKASAIKNVITRVAGSKYYGYCMTLALSVSLVKNLDNLKLPLNPIKRIKMYSEISPLK
jgi:hypothetical protein